MKKRPRVRRARPALSWYLLIHQLPPEPLYLRAKIRQRLSQVGAAPLKKSVYALPRREDCLEDLQWIAQEAIAGGGDAHVCEAAFLERRTESALIDQFRSDRSADYEALARSLLRERTETDPESSARLARARKRFEEISRIDFFGAPAKRKAENLIRQLDAGTRRRAAASGRGARTALTGKTWVTRQGIQVDRIASAWLIRRFLDPQARFRFIDLKEPLRQGELRFDMVGGDFTHEGDRCTFETLIARNGLVDRALGQISQIVHDIDLKDGKFGRAEASGIERLLTGLCLASPEDEARLERGAHLFDELYQSFRSKAPGLIQEVKK